MLSENLAEALNKQINLEFYSAYSYLAMSAHFEAIGLPGAAHWMREQSREEVLHAMKFFDFVNDRGERVVLEAIETPKIPHHGSVREMFERALAGEQHSPVDALRAGHPHQPGNVRVHVLLRATRCGSPGTADAALRRGSQRAILQ